MMMDSQVAMKKLGGVVNLPALPEVVVQMQELLRDSDCGVRELAEVLKKDPPLAARVVRIANSVFYGLRVPVLDLSHAAAFLGIDTLRTVATQVAVANLYAHIDTQPGFDPAGMWKHSVLTARLAASFPSRLSGDLKKEDIYLCGLLHDIGKFVMFERMPEEFARASQASAKNSVPLYMTESKSFGFTHADVGFLVAKRWGLPEVIARAIGEHHNANLAVTEGNLVFLVVAANHIAGEMIDAKAPRMKRRLPVAVAKRLDLTSAELTGLVEQAFVLRNGG